MMEKLAIFGAGAWGMKALEEYGADRIECFIDNDTKRQGTLICGVRVVSLDEYKLKFSELPIYIASTYLQEMSAQLETEGITNYYLYRPTKVVYGREDVLVCNPYVDTKQVATEGEWNEKMKKNAIIKDVDSCVEIVKKQSLPLFNHVEIETYNRCNGVCSFCPVSVVNESRAECRMDTDLFYKVINDLKAINYSGRLALFSNNEPFLDERIIEFHKYTRAQLPNARMHLYTNGTLLTLEKFQEIIDCLDELIIDNYNQELRLIPTVQRIKEYCEASPALVKKVTIFLRKPNEILTTRGGTAPNRKERTSYEKDSCMLPYSQMIIRPDGKVSLCCNDPLGKTTLGDLRTQNIVDVWQGEKCNEVRKLVSMGRENYQQCKYCDVFYRS